MKRMKIFSGIAGWSYADWEQLVYPHGVKDTLAFISEYIDVIEINSTFYRIPEASQCRSWAERASKRDDFFFTAKLHKDITHLMLIEGSMVSAFHKGLEPLVKTGKLKEMIAQFKYDFTATEENKKHLKKIVKSFHDMFEIVVEVRHKSWEGLENLNFLRDIGASLCSLDSPPGPSSFNAAYCNMGRSGYFRMHGRNADKRFSKLPENEEYDHLYRKQELKEIFDRIKNLAEKTERYTVIANNHSQGAAVVNALELKHMITGLKVKVPETLLGAYPQLSEIAVNPNLF